MWDKNSWIYVKFLYKIRLFKIHSNSKSNDLKATVCCSNSTLWKYQNILMVLWKHFRSLPLGLVCYSLLEISLNFQRNTFVWLVIFKCTWSEMFRSKLLINSFKIWNTTKPYIVIKVSFIAKMMCKIESFAPKILTINWIISFNINPNSINLQSLNWKSIFSISKWSKQKINKTHLIVVSYLVSLIHANESIDLCI